MATEPRYPKVPQAMLELWLANQATRTFLQCIDWKRLDARDNLGTGKFADSSSADLTHALTHRSLGEQDAYREALDPIALLTYYNMIEPPEEEPPENADG